MIFSPTIQSPRVERYELTSEDLKRKGGIWILKTNFMCCSVIQTVDNDGTVIAMRANADCWFEWVDTGPQPD